MSELKASVVHPSNKVIEVSDDLMFGFAFPGLIITTVLFVVALWRASVPKPRRTPPRGGGSKRRKVAHLRLVPPPTRLAA